MQVALGNTTFQSLKARLVAPVDDLVEQIGGMAVVREITNFVDTEQRRPGVLFEAAAQ